VLPPKGRHTSLLRSKRIEDMAYLLGHCPLVWFKKVRKPLLGNG
jgi:hypothetical protein